MNFVLYVFFGLIVSRIRKKVWINNHVFPKKVFWGDKKHAIRFLKWSESESKNTSISIIQSLKKTVDYT